MSSTALSQYLWENDIPQKNVSWDIIQKCKPYAPGQRMCQLCVQEKVHILKHTHDTSNLNKRSDLGNLCPHKKKHKLSAYK